MLEANRKKIRTIRLNAAVQTAGITKNQSVLHMVFLSANDSAHNITAEKENPNLLLKIIHKKQAIPSKTGWVPFNLFSKKRDFPLSFGKKERDSALHKILRKKQTVSDESFTKEKASLRNALLPPL